MNVLLLLQERFAKALESLVEDPTPYAAMVRPSQDPRFGDYQANCAMSMKKVLNQNPRDIAQLIIDNLSIDDIAETTEIDERGIGFINVKLKQEWIAEQLQTIAADARLGVPEPADGKTFVIDYSSPNVAKPMHVGHLRSTIIGDALARILRFLGHKVIADNHLGDWGKQFGMILHGWKNHRDDSAYEQDPVGELARLYRLIASKIKPCDTYKESLAEQQKEAKKKARKKKKDDQPASPPPDPEPIALKRVKKLLEKPDLSDEETKQIVEESQAIDQAAGAETAKLHKGDPENRELWQQFMPHCLAALSDVYKQLDIHFDEQLGESAYDDMLPDVVKSLEEKKLAKESEGAIVVEVQGVPHPFMIQFSSGAFNYGTTDLATVKYRQDHFQPDAMLYVVDHRQGDHFKSLFDVARRWGYDHIEMEHVGFGTIMGKDGKPYKTRDGDVVGLESLLNEAVAQARKVVDENSPELSEDERKDVSEIVGLGAVKYADLSQNRMSDYVFDWDKMMAMDGNTATYLQYAFARNRSIFRKGEEDVEPFRESPPPVILGVVDPDYERELALKLLQFPEALAGASTEYKPNLLTDYLFSLAKSYSSFNANCPVLKAETPELRQSRLLLCDLTARVLQKGLELLGIRTAERM